MTIRPATAADREAVVAMAIRYYNTTPYARLLLVDRPRAEAGFDQVLAGGVVLVAESSEPKMLVGFHALLVGEHVLSRDRYAATLAQWVEPRFRTGVLATALLRAAEEWTRRDGGVFVTVAAPAAMPALARFYGACGYVGIETLLMKRVA